MLQFWNWDVEQDVCWCHWPVHAATFMASILLQLCCRFASNDLPKPAFRLIRHEPFDAGEGNGPQLSVHLDLRGSPYGKVEI